MSCGNQSDINQTFIIEPVSSESVLSGCSGIYTNVLNSCSGNTSIFLDTGGIFINGNVSGTTYYGDGSNLTGIISAFRPDVGTFTLVSIQDDVNFPNTAIGNFGFAIGQGTHAVGQVSYAEGSNTTAGGDVSHAEGDTTQALGYASHSENWDNVAQGIASHAGGKESFALGDYSFVHGFNSTAQDNSTIVLGNNIFGVNPDTTYVDNFNVRTLGSGSPVTNLGVDVDGNVVIGMEVIVAVDISGNTIIFTNSTGGTTTAYGLVNTATTININGDIKDLSQNHEWVTAQASTGVLSYAGAFNDSFTTITVRPATGYIVDNETNPTTPVYTYLNYTGETGLTVTTINSGPGSYVLLQSDNTILFQNDFPTSKQRKENILLSKIEHTNGFITLVIDEPDFILSPVSQFRDLFKSIKFINDGVYAYPNGGNLLMNISAGFIFGNGVNFVNDNETPNQVAVGPISSGTPFVYRTQTGGTTDFVMDIDPTMYDVGGVITPAPSTGATIQWIFNVPTAGFAVLYGQTIYTTLSEAVSAVGREIFTVYPNLIENSILIGVLAVTTTATTLSATTQARFLRADKFGQIVGSSAGVGTSTLQSAYDNSAQPQITISPTGGALQIKSFNASNPILQGLNTGGTPTLSVDGFGNLSATTLHGATGGTIGLVLGVQGLSGVPGTYPIAEFNDQTGYFSDWNFRVAGGGSPIINLLQSTGTLQSPNVSNNNGNYGQIVAWGYNTGFSQTAVISLAKDGTPNTGSTPSKITFTTTPIGSVSMAERFSINNQGQLVINAAPSAGTNSDSILVRNSAGSIRQVAFSAVTSVGGIITGATRFTNGLTANTISATTYLGLPTDIYVTGGTYASGTTTITNNTGGTFNITGYTYIPHLLYDNSNKTVWNNGFGDIAGNTSFGQLALVTNSGDENTAIGLYALSGNTTGDYNTAVGTNSLGENNIGIQNTAVGGFSLASNQSGNYNTAVGISSLNTNVSGIGNTAVGSGALFNFNTGIYNVAVGYLALQGRVITVTGSKNIALGFQAGRAVTSGNTNILIENTTLDGVSSGSNNIILNPVQISGIHTGSNNTIIGGFSNTIPDLPDQVVIGTGGGLKRLEFIGAGHMKLTTTPTAGTASDMVLVRNTSTGFIGQVAFSSVFTGGTVNGATVFTAGLTANTISATTYQNLPIDVYVTGGTFSSSSSTIIFTNRTGGTFNVTGITVTSSGSSSGGTEIFVTGGTMSGNTAIFKNNTGGTFNVNGIVNTATTLNINGNLYDLNANREWVTAQGSTGVLSYAGAFMHSSTTINIGAIKGYVIDNETNPLVPTYTYLDFSGQTGVTVTTIGTGTGSYVLLTSANTILFQNEYPTSQQRKENILLSKVGHPNGTVTFVINEPDFILSPVSQIRDLFKSIKYINDGVFAYPNTGLSFNITGGFIFGNGVNFVVDDENPNQVAIGPFTSGTSFVYRTQTGGTSTLVTAITASSYDVAGVITPVPTTASTIQWIFNVPSAGFVVQYGQTLYPSLSEAISAVGRETFTVFPNLIENAILIGVLAVVSTATTLSATSQARFFRADKFGQIVGSQAGVSTATLQSSYDNSIQPQITISPTGGALQIKVNTSNTPILQGLNSVNTVGFNVNGGGAMTGNTIFGTNSITSPTISATTYLNLPSASFSGGTVSGATRFLNGLTANTISATTYQNLPFWSAGTGTNAIAQKFGNNIASGILAVAENSGTTAFGDYSHAEGTDTTASGHASHVEGNFSFALGIYSHAEGDFSVASGFSSHAEGAATEANGDYSHAEGVGTKANGARSHAEGDGSIANGIISHAEGGTTLASGQFSHAEGNLTQASGDSSHAEGTNTQAIGENSHAEGNFTFALGNDSHSEGNSATANGNLSHAEGFSTTTYGEASHSEGQGTIASGGSSHAEGLNTQANGTASHSEGVGTRANGLHSHAEGDTTIADGLSSHAEGFTTNALGIGSHAEGNNSIAGGDGSHAEGDFTVALGFGSHAEGGSSTAVGDFSHAEGTSIANGIVSHAEGDTTQANGLASHAEGTLTTAASDNSHAEGLSTTAQGQSSHAEGTNSVTNGNSAHAEGSGTIADNNFTHAEGFETQALMENAHAEGYRSIASGSTSHAEGYQTHANGERSHTEGYLTFANGLAAHAEGQGSVADGASAHAEGFSTQAAGDNSHAEGRLTQARADYSHAEGLETQNDGVASHVEGYNTYASGGGAHAEGQGTTATGNQSHSEGYNTTAGGENSHAGGLDSQANGINSFVHGSGSTAGGINTIVLGGNIVGNTDNTTYVDKFNIKTVGSSTPVTNLGIDSTGNVVSGTTGGGGGGADDDYLLVVSFRTLYNF